MAQQYPAGTRGYRMEKELAIKTGLISVKKESNVVAMSIPIPLRYPGRQRLSITCLKDLCSIFCLDLFRNQPVVHYKHSVLTKIPWYEPMLLSCSQQKHGRTESVKLDTVLLANIDDRKYS